MTRIYKGTHMLNALIIKRYNSVKCTIGALQQLGFTIHSRKSILIPTQVIDFLGFIINSVHMTITITDRKKEKIKGKCILVLQQETPKIRDIAQLIGNLVATTETVPLAPLYYRATENATIQALKTYKGDFEQGG